MSDEAAGKVPGARGTAGDPRADLAPRGVLRAGINMSNPLLVTGRTPAGDPDGVAPALAAEIAGRLGVPLALVPYPSPGVLADQADAGEWDIALLGADPGRAGRITFSPAYVEIPATCLVRDGSPLRAAADLDTPGVTIVAVPRSAYGLWLSAHLRHARLAPAGSTAEAVAMFARGTGDALAGLRSALTEAAAGIPGSAVLPGTFMTVQQAVGTRKDSTAGAAFLRGFVEEAKASGLVARLIARYQVGHGLRPAPAEAVRED